MVLQENAGSELQTASIYGTAKATQEADNVIILQVQGSGLGDDEKYLQVKDSTQLLLVMGNGKVIVFR